MYSSLLGAEQQDDTNRKGEREEGGGEGEQDGVGFAGMGHFHPHGLHGIDVS